MANESVYEMNGFRNRLEYLTHLSEEYEVPIQIVGCLAELLGPGEDFDGLIGLISELRTFQERAQL